VHAVGQRLRVVVGPALVQRRRQLGVRPRLRHEQRTSTREQLVDVHAFELPAVRAAAVERAGEDRLDDRAQGQAVARGEQVDCRAHHRDPDGLPVADQRRQLVRVEAVQPRPERHVRRLRQLRLQADHVLDRLRRRHLHPAQQQLAMQQRAVQRPLAKHLRDHATRMAYRRNTARGRSRHSPTSCRCDHQTRSLVCT